MTSPQPTGAAISSPISLRPAFHLSVPDNWKNDPQRPIFLNGEYHYYYLYNGDYLAGGIGTSWRRTTTVDHVVFRDQGVAIEKNGPNGDCWSGSLVVDHADTAGYGAGAVIALVTQAPAGVQGQYLWFSTDGGTTFRAGGADPVLPNPGVPDFRDPKVVRDEVRDRWVMVNAEGDRLGFYTSANLRDWVRVSEFVRDDIGLLECPDLFEMTATDGTSHWILGLSPNHAHPAIPSTYAYWSGAFNGSEFTPDQHEPDWLDYGFDFYGAVTYPHYDLLGAEDRSMRHVLGWANFWDYPHNAPTIFTDGYNGDDMIVRDIRLSRVGARYVLLSQPTSGLSAHVTATHRFGDIEVSGIHDLPLHARAYELQCDVTWDAESPPVTVGCEVQRASEGERYLRVGASLSDAELYVDRRRAINPGGGISHTPLDPEKSNLRLRFLVDHTSVELFVYDGRYVHSHRVFPLPSDDGIRFFVTGGTAVFTDITVHEIVANSSREPLPKDLT